MSCPLCRLRLFDVGTCSQPTVEGIRYRIKECGNGHRIAMQSDGTWRECRPGRKPLPWNEPMAKVIGPGWGFAVHKHKAGRPLASPW